jgi:hypothetical protein
MSVYYGPELILRSEYAGYPFIQKSGTLNAYSMHYLLCNNPDV